MGIDDFIWISSRGLIRGGAYLLQEHFTWGLFEEGGLFEGGGLIEALRYLNFENQLNNYDDTEIP